jgi:hypothetical protein
VSLSAKDRGAVLTAGKRPDACYWLDTTDAQWVTSSYYRDQVHPWVAELNKTHPADAYFGKPWERLLPELDYEKYSGPDDAKGESEGIKQGRTFPHAMDGGLKKPGRMFYEAVYTSPYGNEMLMELVRRAVVSEKLGQGDTADLLCISFSSNDPVGHAWGPDSQEVLDTTLRSDRILAELLKLLDNKVGKGRYIVALSADHGICPLPEVSVAEKRAAGRVDPKVFAKAAEAHLEDVFGDRKVDDNAPWLEDFVEEAFTLNRARIKAAGLKVEKVAEELAKWAGEQKGIEIAYTRAELLEEPARGDALGRMMRRSFHAERSGDVLLLLKPYWLMARTTGTNHGTPHEYDTHVPLLVYGPGIVPGVRKERVRPQAATVVLAKALGVPAPAKADTPLPERLFE